MRELKMLILVAAIALLGQMAPAGNASAAQDARSAWASVAANYDFNHISASPGSSFADNYHGDDLYADFEDAIGATANIMGTAFPPLDPDDILDVSLMNWPDD